MNTHWSVSEDNLDRDRERRVKESQPKKKGVGGGEQKSLKIV